MPSTSKVSLEPVGHIANPPLDLPPEYAVFVDHVAILPCPPEWPGTDTVIFRASKISREHLMLPEAHFYGPDAYGILIRHNRTHGDPVLWKAGDVAAGERGRKMTLLLCRRDGGALPEMSDALYPSNDKVVVPVDYATYHRFCPGCWVTLVPDARRNLGGPAQTWIYVDTVGEETCDPDAVRLAAESQKRNHKLGCWTVIKYGIAGSVLRRKIIRPPLSRDAGFHTAPGPLSRDRATPSVHGEPLHVKTKKFVLPDHDFRIGGIAVRVVRLSKNGFRAHRLH